MRKNANFAQLEIPVVKKLYDLYKFTHRLISKFPKHERYSLGEKMERHILDAMELVIFANAQPKNFRESCLSRASAKTEILKILFRLIYELGFASDKEYLHAEEALQEIGRMLGGWIKYLKTN